MIKNNTEEYDDVLFMVMMINIMILIIFVSHSLHQ